MNKFIQLPLAYGGHQKAAAAKRSAIRVLKARKIGSVAYVTGALI